MARWLVTLGLCLGVACGLWAGEVGQLQPSACPAPMALLASWYQGYGTARTADATGLVNPKAVWMVCESYPPAGRSIAVAIDSDSADAAQPNLMRLDLSGRGDFTSAATAKLVPDPKRPGGFRTQPEDSTKLTIDGREIPIHVDGTYRKTGNDRQFRVKIGTCLAGACQFADKTYPVQIRDANLDFNCTDRAGPDVPRIQRGDVVYIDTTGQGFGGSGCVIAYLGQPVCVDGAWHDVAVSPDAASVSAAPIDVTAGTITFPNPHCELFLLGERHALVYVDAPANTPIPVPVDTYAVCRFKQFVVYNQQDKGALLVQPYDTFASGPDSPRFDVPAGRNVDLRLGTPLAPKLKVDYQAGQAVFSFQLRDAGGNAFINVGDQPLTCELAIKDAQGVVVHQGEFEFG